MRIRWTLAAADDLQPIHHHLSHTNFIWREPQ
jgi:hypothetical protein